MLSSHLRHNFASSELAATEDAKQCCYLHNGRSAPEKVCASTKESLCFPRRHSQNQSITGCGSDGASSMHRSMRGFLKPHSIRN